MKNSAFALVLCAALWPVWLGAAPACETFEAGFSARYGKDSQLLLNLVLAQGRNRASVERMGRLPEAAFYRQLATGVEDLQVNGDAVAAFMPQDQLAENFRTLADLLERALPTEPGSNQWRALKDFYKPGLHGRMGAALQYQLELSQCASSD